MARIRSVAELLSGPRDLKWEELSAYLVRLGFTQNNRTGSSLVKFVHPKFSSRVIQLHRTHGRSPATVLVKYVVSVGKRLKEWGYE